MSDSGSPDLAETIDEDRVGTQDLPPDEPLGVPELLGRDVETAGAYAPDSVAERSVREEPGGTVDDGAVIDLAQADGVRTDLVAEVGEPDPHAPIPSDEATADDPDMAAEAAAVHVVES